MTLHITFGSTYNTNYENIYQGGRNSRQYRDERDFRGVDDVDSRLDAPLDDLGREG